MVRRLLVLSCAFAIPVACATSNDGVAPSNGAGGSGSGSSSGGAADSGAHDAGLGHPSPSDASAPDDSSAPSGDDSSAPTDAAPTEVALPFYVSDQFVPSGFMGDSQASMQAITLTHDAAHCLSPRDPAAGGDCYGVTWSPTPPDGGSSWAGVYWQSPAGNWGKSAGKAIAAGATKVSFLAAGAAGGETIQACAGGINANGADPTLPHGDTFNVKSPSIVLTTTWTRYEISLQGAQYTDVLGGFCWVAAATTPAPATFYIDDVHWE